MASITEAVQAIQATAREAEANLKAVSWLDTPDPRTKLLVRGQTTQEFHVPPAIRKHTMLCLQDLIAYAETLKATPESPPVFWHAPHKVILITNDADRRDRVEFPLALSDAWKRLESLDAKGSLTQREFIWLLKYLGASEATITLFRRLDFRTMVAASGEVAKGRESLGKQIEAECKGTADLPDDLIIRVPIYSTAGEQDAYDVRLLIDYDAQSQRIVAMPEPDCLEHRVQAHQASIHERLTAALPEVAVYYGTP